jgi:hypothetical protein
VWNVPGAVASGTWPEWIGSRALDFRVVVATGRVDALIHRTSSKHRTRAGVETAIAERIEAAQEEAPVDISDLVGGPDRPLMLDEDGDTLPRVEAVQPDLPVVLAKV